MTRTQEDDLQDETWDEAWLMAAANAITDEQEEVECDGDPEDHQAMASSTKSARVNGGESRLEQRGNCRIGPTLGRGVRRGLRPRERGYMTVGGNIAADDSSAIDSCAPDGVGTMDP